MQIWKGWVEFYKIEVSESKNRALLVWLSLNYILNYIFGIFTILFAQVIPLLLQNFKVILSRIFILQKFLFYEILVFTKSSMDVEIFQNVNLFLKRGTLHNYNWTTQTTRRRWKPPKLIWSTRNALQITYGYS